MALEVITDSAALLSTYGSAIARIVDVDGKRALYTESGVLGGTLGTRPGQHPRGIQRNLTVPPV